MRILIVNYEYPPIGGGAGNASRSLADALTRQGHAVSVVTSGYSGYRGRSDEAGVQVHRIRARRRSIHRSNPFEMLCFAGSALLSAPKIARRQQTEVVIAFFTIPSGIVGYWLKRRDRIPYLVSLRGGDVPGLVPELKHIHRVTGAVRGRVLRSAGGIVANSLGLAQLSENQDPFPVEVIPNGVDSALFRPRKQEEPPLRQGNFTVLFVGRLQKQKNLELLLNELARLLRENATSLTLHVAGDGPLATAMTSKAERLGLGRDVVWHGWLSKEKLIALYQSADCFVSPSFYEGMPNTILEAMACGLPVVASRIPGNEVAVLDGETGVLVSLDEPKQLGRALTSLAENPSVAREMGNAGRVRVVEQFSWDAVAEQYVEALGRMAPRRPTPNHSTNPVEVQLS